MSAHVESPTARDPIAWSRERFIGDTSEHVMEIIRDDDLDRHLRFKKPGDSTFWFDIVTWRGVLVITGDCGTFVFSRIADMFEFFGPKPGSRGGIEDQRWGINPQYWSEKLRAPSPRDAETYSEDLFKSHVQGWFKQVCEDDGLTHEARASLRLAIDEQLLGYSDAGNGEHSAHTALRDFEHNGIRIHDAWEWHLREYRYDFLWCCWAIVWGIGKYNEALA